MESNQSASGRPRAIAAFALACEVARRGVPSGLKAGQEFAQACLHGTKIKAELLSKTLSSSHPHHELLDFSAVLRGFQGWQELNQFARRFAAAEDSEREGWPQSFMMATALWRLTPADEENPLVKSTLARALEVLLTRGPEKVDRPAAELILRRIMFQKDPDRVYWGANKQVMQRVWDGLEYYLGVTPATVVHWLLRRVPVVDGRRSDWPSLSSMTVAQVMELPLANTGHQAGFGYEGWAHSVADLINELETYAQFGAAAETSPFLDSESALQELSSEIEQAVSSPLARIICRDFLTELLKPHLTSTVESILTHNIGESGFYLDFYSGPPEKIESDWAENYRLGNPGGIKRVVFREPFDGFQLSIFRLRRRFETSGPRLYEFEAVVHDNSDVLIAKLGLVLFIGEGETEPYDLAWALDEHDHDDLREVGLGLAQAAYRFEIDDALLDRVMVLREWEVRKDHRGKGLGKKLLNEAIRRSIRGLAAPSVLACRLCPIRFVIQPYREWVVDAKRGASSILHRELAVPVIELQEIFRRSVGPGTFVAEKEIELFDAPYLPWVHRGHELTLLAMSLARPPA